MKKINILSAAVAALTLFSASSVFAAVTTTESKTVDSTQVTEEVKPEEAQTEGLKAEGAKEAAK